MQETSASSNPQIGGQYVANSSQQCSKFKKFGGRRENVLSAKPSRIKGISPRDIENSEGRVRCYDPSTGRFMSQDPIGLAGGDANLYRYVWNQPTKLVDPFGYYGIIVPIVVFPPTSLQIPTGTSSTLLEQLGQISNQIDVLQNQQQTLQQQLNGANQCGPQSSGAGIQEELSDLNGQNVCVLGNFSADLTTRTFQVSALSVDEELSKTTFPQKSPPDYCCPAGTYCHGNCN